MLSSAKPSARALSGLAVMAMKCRSAPSPSRARMKAPAARWLYSVSAVPKLLDDTRNSVRSGSQWFSSRFRGAGSTVETKSTRMSGEAWACRASSASAGPQYEPPMPRFTTCVKRCPVAPVRTPLRTASAMSAICRCMVATPDFTSCPFTTMADSRESRSAVCSAGRFSVWLIGSPANSAARQRGRSAASASASSASSAASSSRCFDRSTCRPATSRV